jgi:hypothetical protein
MNEFAINWIFLVDTLNFSFWSDHELLNSAQLLAEHKGLSDSPVSVFNNSIQLNVIEKYTVTYNHVPYTGYWAFCAAVNRVIF